MSKIEQVLVPDIGKNSDVEVIEVNVAVGDTIDAQDTLITLESDKASMEIPSPFSGQVATLDIAVGDKVSQGTLVLTMAVDEAQAQEKEEASEEKPNQEKPSTPAAPATPRAPAQRAPEQSPAPAMATKPGEPLYASPSVRRIAREFGVNLREVTGSGRKGRLLKTDVQAFVKRCLQDRAQGTGALVPAAPAIDFSQFGEVERIARPRIKKLSASFLHRNWVSIPHVTQFHEADITQMESFRQQHKSDCEKLGFKLTPLVFVMKAVIGALEKFPEFNVSLDPDGEHVIAKKYFHLGIAVDTEQGLVVPVVRDVDKKGLYTLAEELHHISNKARAGKLSAQEMQGSCFSITSLGGVGGSAFTPIINAPDVAILGLSKSTYKPVLQDDTWVPRLMLPLSLSYDHRVIDGVQAARFIVFLGEVLSEIQRLLL